MARPRKTNAERVAVHSRRKNATVYASPAVMPPADRRWHSRARRWYEDLEMCPQAVHYQLSDWNLAWVAAVDLSDWLSLDPEERLRRKPTLWMQSQRLLMTTHLNRVNGRMEVEPAGQPESPGAVFAPSNVVALKDRFG